MTGIGVDVGGMISVAIGVVIGEGTVVVRIGVVGTVAAAGEDIVAIVGGMMIIVVIGEDIAEIRVDTVEGMMTGVAGLGLVVGALEATADRTATGE
jgi:hypothetical protein